MTRTQWAIIAGLGVAVVVVFCVLAIIGATVARPTIQAMLATPTPTCDPKPYVLSTGKQMDRFIDLEKVASATSRIALSPIITQMQDTRRDVENMDYVKCAIGYRNALIDVMDSTIDVYISFMADDTTGIYNARVKLNARTDKLKSELDVISGKSPASGQSGAR